MNSLTFPRDGRHRFGSRIGFGTVPDFAVISDFFFFFLVVL